VVFVGLHRSATMELALAVGGSVVEHPLGGGVGGR
jgi:hypothetical protein